MNKNLIALTLVTLLCSCGENFCTRHTREYVVSNTIPLDMYFTVYTDAGADTLFLNQKGDASMIMDKQSCRTFGTYFSYDDYLNEINIGLYNLSDTTSYQLDYSITDTKEDSLFMDHVVFSDDVVHDTWCVSDSFVLTIDSTLLPIFKKDYSMLEQFSEYYK